MPVLFFALAAAVLTGLLFGVVPAMQSAGANAADVLRESSRGASPGSRSARLRRVLVVAEIALSLVLLAGAGLLIESFQRVVHGSLGFEPDHVLGVEVFLAANRYPREPAGQTARFRAGCSRSHEIPAWCHVCRRCEHSSAHRLLGRNRFLRGRIGHRQSPTKHPVPITGL